MAIKTFKRTVDIDEFKAVLAELKMLAYLGDHDFIVKFVGAEISEIAQRETVQSPLPQSRCQPYIFTGSFVIFRKAVDCDRTQS